jgi:Tfp pilus assembly PilM family ATPase
MLTRAALSNVVLHPDPTIVMNRQIEIPEAAGAQIRNLLEFDMDKWTPYSFAEVYVAWTTKSSHERTKLNVQLYFSPRTHVDPVLADLERWGLKVSALALGPTCPDVHLRRAQGRNSLYYYATTAAALLSLVVVDWTSMVESRNRSTERHAFEAKQYADQRSLQELFTRTMASVGSARNSSRRSETLRAVSTALPETDWLQEVVIKSESITLRGFTAKIEALSKALEPLAERGEVDIQGEVAYDATLDRSRFSLTYVERRS